MERGLRPDLPALSDSDPSYSPLDLPVAVWWVEWEGGSPLFFPVCEGKSPGKTFSRALATHLRLSVCEAARRGAPPCGVKSGGQALDCRDAAGCHAQWLYKPRAADGAKNYPRPVLVWAPALEERRPVTRFAVRLVLWGRVALGSGPRVMDALLGLEEKGIELAGQVARVRLVDVKQGAAQTLGERVELVREQRPMSALLAFSTSFIHTQTLVREGDVRDRGTIASGQLPLAEILANVAYETTAWDIEDRGAVGEASPLMHRHTNARQAREAAREAAYGVQVIASRLEPAYGGMARSKGNAQGYPENGFWGWAQISGNLQPLLPWLAALSLAGGGQHRADGFGVVGVGWGRD